MPASVLIVEDEPEFLRRFSHAVLSAPGFGLAGTALTARVALELVDAQAPDLVLVHLGLPDAGAVAVVRHAARNPACDVLVLTMFDDDQRVLDAIGAGAAGYLLKDAAPAAIVAGLREAREGGAPLSPGIARRILERARLRGAGVASLDEPDAELLRLAARGLSLDAISQSRGLSPRLVLAQVRGIYRKLSSPAREPLIAATGHQP